MGILIWFVEQKPFGCSISYPKAAFLRPFLEEVQYPTSSDEISTWPAQVGAIAFEFNKPYHIDGSREMRLEESMGDSIVEKTNTDLCTMM